MTQFNIPLSKLDRSKGLVLPLTITPELAYLIGVLTGDGCIHYRKNKHEYSIHCAGHPIDEKSYYDLIIRSLLKNLFGISPAMQFFKKNKKGTIYGFRIYSKSLFLYLTQVIGLPIGKKYDYLQIPLVILERPDLIPYFIQGLFDTDGCISFKKRYRDYPYYPVISLSSKKDYLINQVTNYLRNAGFNVATRYNYRVKDKRNKKCYTIISRLEMSGFENLNHWCETLNFQSPKHLEKINKYYLKVIAREGFEPPTIPKNPLQDYYSGASQQL